MPHSLCASISRCVGLLSAIIITHARTHRDVLTSSGQPRSGTSTSIVRSGFIGRLAGFAMPAAASNDSWQDYVAACDVMCCVVGTDGNICAANEALASRAGCSIAELRAAPLTALLVQGQSLPTQFEELLRAGVQGVASSIPLLYLPWRSGAIERVEVRVSPRYDSTTGSMGKFW